MMSVMEYMSDGFCMVITPCRTWQQTHRSDHALPVSGSNRSNHALEVDVQRQ
jgi:hypothetical protein